MLLYISIMGKFDLGCIVNLCRRLQNNIRYLQNCIISALLEWFLTFCQITRMVLVICESLKGDRGKEVQRNRKMSVERCEKRENRETGTRKRDEPVTEGCKTRNR